MTTLLPVLALVLIGGRFSARIATRLRLPALFGELVLGLALGPFVLHWLDGSPTFGVLGDLGVLLLMLLVGLET
ncbi:MAG: cation:proton antiporter domain-containing protein, partial [Ktedonobacterales bacterium]